MRVYSINLVKKPVQITTLFGLEIIITKKATLVMIVHLLVIRQAGF